MAQLAPTRAERAERGSTRRDASRVAPRPPVHARLQRSLGNRGVSLLIGEGLGRSRHAGSPQAADPVQRAPVEETGDVHAAAARGVRSGGGSLPHLDRITASFGPQHGLDTVQAHVGGAAGDASRAIGARAYTTGEHIAFDATPDVALAAHEAAHVVQQRSGVQLPGGVGESGDAYERQADAVAGRVVAGRSAQDLLPGGGSPSTRRVQPSAEPAPEAGLVQLRELRGEGFPWKGVIANTPAVWFRSEARMGDNKIRQLAEKTEVSVTGVSGNWLQVEHGGDAGYVYKNYIIEEFEVEATKSIGDVCEKPACLAAGGCIEAKCKEEAAVIAESYVSRVNRIRKPSIANVSDRHWGWLCYQWAGLLMREFTNLNLSCWKINWVGFESGVGSLEHNYVFVSLEDITPSGVEPPKRACGVILDPWRTGDPVVYDVSWSWHKWNYIHDPATNKGKSFTGGAWTDVTYPPPWTPAEPAPSPTVTTP